MKRLLIPLLFLVGCSVNSVNETQLELQLTLDGRKPLDQNGYYHIQLDSTRNQTIHTISGRVLNQERPVKVEWYSNLVWYFNGEEVPTINSSSYSNDEGEVFVVIAPIYKMKGDTLIINSHITETQITEKIKFVLE